MNSAQSMIDEYESALRNAMLANDVKALDALLDDDLVFTAPNGQVLSKEDDLAAHRSKVLRIAKLDLHDTQAYTIDAMILVTTKAALAGSYGEVAFEGVYAYTRLWRRHGEVWRVVAGHAGVVA